MGSEWIWSCDRCKEHKWDIYGGACSKGRDEAVEPHFEMYQICWLILPKQTLAKQWKHSGRSAMGYESTQSRIDAIPN